MCPVTAVCPGGARLYPKAGYWHSARQSVQVHKCFNPAACVGAAALNGSTAAAADSQRRRLLGAGDGVEEYKTAQCNVAYQGNLCGAWAWLDSWQWLHWQQFFLSDVRVSFFRQGCAGKPGQSLCVACINITAPLFGCVLAHHCSLHMCLCVCASLHLCTQATAGPGTARCVPSCAASACPRASSSCSTSRQRWP